MSAFQNGGNRPRRGSSPAPAIIPRSISRTVQTPSSRIRQASTRALSENISTSSSTFGSASPSRVGSPSL